MTRVNDTTLYQTLIARTNRDTETFVHGIPYLCKEAADRAKHIPVFFTQYTLHDETHFLRVTELMAQILGETLHLLNDIEIGLLILSAYFHDQGMLISRQDYEELIKSEKFQIFRDNWIIDHPNYREIKIQSESSYLSEQEKKRLRDIIDQLDAAILTDFLRVEHAQLAYEFIIKTYSNERMLTIGGTNLSEYLGNICLSHVQNHDWYTQQKLLHYDEDISTYKVNSIFLSIILRLADILDFDSDRTPDVLYKSIHFTSPISISEWQKHRNVRGWTISQGQLRFSMQFEHPVYEKTARNFIDWIDKELTFAHSSIRNFPSQVLYYKICIPEKVDISRLQPKGNAYLYYDLEFTLSRDEIVKLLMTDNLYRNPSLCIRELLQNSLDALRLRKANYQKEGLNWNSGEVFFRHYIDPAGQEVIECIDNGCGMDEGIVTNFLGKVGRSYYRSPEFEKIRMHLKEKGVDFDPCSQFGIGFLSCFMIGDRIQIKTRKDNCIGQPLGRPLLIEINGLGGLFVIKEGSQDQEPGTTVRIFSRQKPIFFDIWTDKIRLVTTLRGYALATEFPISAACEIDDIKDQIHIPVTIDNKITFLEKLKLSKIRTFEIDLNKINKNIRGSLRQSFLVDEKGLLNIENEEAHWGVEINTKKFKEREDFETIL